MKIQYYFNDTLIKELAKGSLPPKKQSTITIDNETYRILDSKKEIKDNETVGVVILTFNDPLLPSVG